VVIVWVLSSWGVDPPQGGHGGAIALGDQVQGVAASEHQHAVGSEHQLDRFPQQRLHQQADATRSVVRPEVLHQTTGELGPAAIGQPALGQELRQVPQPHHSLAGGLHCAQQVWGPGQRCLVAETWRGPVELGGQPVEGVAGAHRQDRCPAEVAAQQDVAGVGEGGVVVAADDAALLEEAVDHVPADGDRIAALGPVHLKEAEAGIGVGLQRQPERRGPAPIRKEVRSGCFSEHLLKLTPGGAL
jgi:hypothetical protein